MLLDLGSHLIDQAVLLFGPVRSVYAELERRHAQAEVEDDAFVALDHAAGIRSHLWMSSMAAHAGPRFRLLGSAGAYVKHGLDGQEAALRDGASPVDPGFGREPEIAWGRLTSGDAGETTETLAGRWPLYYAGIEHALRHGTSPPVDASDAVRTLQLIEAARRSATLGQVINVATDTSADVHRR